MTTEPKIIAPHREELAYLLTEASEIEHGLMCCYLYAAFSLDSSNKAHSAQEAAAVVRWRRAIVDVAIDEMLHLSLVNNLLTAIGSTPHFQRANFPVSAGYHPAGVVVSLAPFDAATIDHFIYLERPEGIDLPDGAGFDPPAPYERIAQEGRLVPSAQDYATVGHLYRGIRAAVVHLAAHYGEKQLFVGDPRAQVTAAIAPIDGIVAVTDVASALVAIDTIVEQGEGSPSNPEHSHYRRFVGIRDEHRALLAEHPDFRPAHPAARNPVMRRPPDPRNKVHVDHPTTARVLDLGNAFYAFALRCLGRAFGEAEDPEPSRAALVSASLATMRALSPVGELLARSPASLNSSANNAGLTFTMQRSTVGFSQQRAAWAILGERAKELATASRKLVETDAPSLRSVAEAMQEIATSIELATPR